MFLPRVITFVLVSHLICGILASENKNGEIDYDRIMEMDFFELFGIEKADVFNTEQLRTEFLKYQRKYKRLLNTASSEQKEKIEEILMHIQEAYNTMADSEARQRYLEQETTNLTLDNILGQSNPLDFLMDLIHISDRRSKAPRIHHLLHLTIEQIFKGGAIKIEIEKDVICHRCKGSGAVDNEIVETCSKCNGSGLFVRTLRRGPIIQYTKTTCPDCKGSGENILHPCIECHGKKTTSSIIEYEINILAGIESGYYIIEPGIGNEYPGMKTGDILFEIVEDSHQYFSRKNNDLYVTEVLSLLEALKGFERTIEDPARNQIILKRSKVTQNGDVDVFPDHGMPILDKYEGKFIETDIRGCLYVIYKVLLPETYVEIVTKSDGTYHLEL